MALAVRPPVAPMLAKSAEAIPLGDDWLYEPKWDGFRAIAFRDGDSVHLGSRNGQPLERYFPEVVAGVLEATPDPSVIDGEIVIAAERGLDFDALQLRIHPAASRVAMLAGATPASFVAFDLLALATDLRGDPFHTRRARLQEAVARSSRVFLTPQTADPTLAAQWFERFEGAGLDGIVAKRGEGAYLPGERVMMKVKHRRTTDCVVGGYRMARDDRGLGSLLLGLHDESGVLHHVGHTSSFTAVQRRAVLELVAPLEGGSGFGGGREPGGPSRWSRGDMSWVAIEPRLVCEVAFDHMQGGRFRHGATFVRWRPDREPASCTFGQLEPPRPFSLDEIVRLGG